MGLISSGILQVKLDIYQQKLQNSLQIINDFKLLVMVLMKLKPNTTALAHTEKSLQLAAIICGKNDPNNSRLN